MSPRTTKHRDHTPVGELLDRTPPHSVEAERAVLGSAMLDPRLLDELAAILDSPDAFHVHAHQVLYQHMLAMDADGAQLDVALLRERLRQHGDLEAVGGSLYVAEVLQSVPTAANAVYYANIVRGYALRRATIHAAADILRDAYEGTIDTTDLIASMHSRADGLSERTAGVSVVTASQAVESARMRIQSLLTDRYGTSLDTGLTELDQRTGGMFPGELVVPAARTSVGKTALAVQISVRHAFQGRSVLFFSSEMKAAELALRAVCARAGVSGGWIRNRSVTDRELAMVETAAEEFRKIPLFIDQSTRPSAIEIRHTARRLHRRAPLRLIVIDHLQRLRGADERRSLNEQIGKLAADAKNLALELDIPVLLLSQVNRDSDKAHDHKPRLSNLSQSGVIETDADQVWILHRPELYKRDPDLRGVAEINVAKNRNGATGEFSLRWDAALTTFRDAPSQQNELDDESKVEQFLQS
ncbi:MAG TPA: replicative DNA helicase [Pirellulales bacterium]|nr:replicative DNA helicase [Pirellulales bacterium]